mgnify:CR=1 FL=1
MRWISRKKTFVLHTGVPFLYRSAHIPGSVHVGQASTAEGIEKLKKEVQGLPRDKEIILYCGCCPWKDCPNMRPAFKAMQEMGFTKIKALYLPNNLEQDWIEKGFPIEK